MREFLRFFIVLTLLASVGLSVTAQEDGAEMGSSNLAALLRFVPDNDEARWSISYSDHQAAAAARPLGAVPQNFDDFESLNRDASALWLASMPIGGIELNNFARFNEMPQSLGLDFFQIKRSLVWGTPPDRGFVLQGNFDEDAIRAAHQARGFVESEWDGIPLWCSADGCDAGFQTNLRDLHPADIFGGDLGRKFPRALSGDFLISAAVDISLEQMTDAGINGEDSLSNDPSFQAVVAALDGDHYLRAVQFASPSDFLALDVNRFPANVSEERLREIVEALRGGPENLPVYNLAVIADIADTEQEYGVIGLVYRTEELATMAAEILVKRINAAESAAVNLPWIELISNRGATLEAPSVFYAPDADRYVTLITISKPLPPNERQDGAFVQSGILFQLFLGSYFRQDLGWLQPVLLT